MDAKKILKLFYSTGTSGGGNKGRLPEKGKGPSPKPKAKTFADELREISSMADSKIDSVADDYASRLYKEIKPKLIESARDRKHKLLVQKDIIENYILGGYGIPTESNLKKSVLKEFKNKLNQDGIKMKFKENSNGAWAYYIFSWNK